MAIQEEKGFSTFQELLNLKLEKELDKRLTKKAKETAEQIPVEQAAKMLTASKNKNMSNNSSNKETSSNQAQNSGVNILQQLMQGLSSGNVSKEQVFGAINELANTQVEQPGTSKGIIDAIKTGGGFGQPYTQPLGINDATNIVKKLIETSTLVGKEQREEQKFPIEIKQMNQSLVQGDIKTAADMLDLADRARNPQLKKSLEEEVSRLYGKPMTSEELRKMREEEAIKKAELAGKIEGVKEAAKVKVQDLESAKKNSRTTFRFLQQFGRSLEELKKFDPAIEEEGFGGFIKRRGAEIASKFDSLPETKALQIQIQPLANSMAREIEGGRVTDQDRKIYADSFANAIQNPGTTNIRLASNSILNILDLGGEGVLPQLKQMASMDVDIFNNILNQVFMEYPELVTEIYGEGAEVIE